MLFFKPRQKADDFLPPPPPFSDEEQISSLDEPEQPRSQFSERPKFFDEILNPKKSKPIPEEDEFSSLVKEVEGINFVKPIKNKIIKPIQKSKFKKLKIPAKNKKPAEPKAIKAKSKPSVKQANDTSKILQHGLERDFGLDDVGFEEHGMPKEDFEFPDDLQGFGIGDIGHDIGKAANSKEILEAQEEIRDAIEKIKKKDEISFFGRLFSWKKENNLRDDHPAPVQSGNGIFMIQVSLKSARDALMKFDLMAAKKDYIEIMKLYNTLNPEDKAKVYHDINDLYSERKSAEELKV